MKFDAARVTGTIEKLAGAQSGEHDSEANVADLVARQFAEMGMAVQRREVVGSRFPQRLAPWVGWLVYCALITASFVLVLGNHPVPVILLLTVGLAWLLAVLGNRIRVGHRRPPLEAAPLVIASLPSESSPPVRVVFQAVLGGLKTDLFLAFHPDGRRIALSLHISLLLSILAKLADLPGGIPLHLLNFLLFASIWIEIAGALWWEFGWPRSVNRSQTDRRGLAVLLELARCWPRSQSGRVEAVFVAAGGQRLDYAGSREVVRLFESEWSSKPTLLVLFFAPGAGDELLVFGEGREPSGVKKLADEAAKGLWIPIRRAKTSAIAPFWPIVSPPTMESIAIIGSDLNAFSDAPVDPQVLHRAIQLSSEIALRWAKKHRKPTDSQGDRHPRLA